ncbi:hypothetical protein BJ165DRAFT_1472061 [Panaeolus papilionaceus]|nr:hypothetical protein BJ165DRAFT_1472061 [Panaeolus papilionaceus]
MSYGTRSISFTAPLSTHIQTNTDFEPDVTPASTCTGQVGTFLVREDVEHTPFVPKTPGRNKKVKDIFTPLPLERMFDPPSPPSPQSQPNPISNEVENTPLSRSYTPRSPQQAEEMSDEIVETDMPNMNSFHGRKASLACQFTFSVPREPTGRLSGLNLSPFPQAQSTPNPPPVPTRNPPPSDSRLRLFQFQYDTYTREHLSALVDSIAINTPSGTGTAAGTPTSFSNGLSRVTEATGSTNNVSHMRSAKRIKLSPTSDFNGQDEGLQVTIARPKLYGQDYVGESRSLMQQIKQARDFSTISTVASTQNDSPSPSTPGEANIRSRMESFKRTKSSLSESIQRPSLLSVPEPSTSNTSLSNGAKSTGTSYSSSSYRLKAAALMEQIKSDVKRPKRVFSGDSELSHATTHVEDNTYSLTHSFTGSVKLGAEAKDTSRHSNTGHRRTSSQKSTSSHRPSPRKPHKKLSEEGDLVSNLSRISIKDQAPIVNVTLVPSNNTIPSADPGQLGPAPPRSTLAPPSYPSIRLTNNEDLNRFVSSSTASGTTVTAGSAPSFTKHAGPAHIRTIAPSDIPPLPDRFGDMVYDKELMKWVRTGRRSSDPERTSQSGEVSDDPFGDIESLRDESAANEDFEPNSTSRITHSLHITVPEMSRISEHSEIEDEEEFELSNFSTDASAHIVNVMTGVEGDGYEDDQTTDSDDEHDDIHTATQQPPGEIIDFMSDDDESPSRPNRSFSGRSPAKHNGAPGHLAPPLEPSNGFSTPSRTNLGPNGTPIIKSVLKSNSVTPSSVLRNRSSYQTPLQRKSHQRSVSFSDGKREGPIQGITASGGYAASARSKRIADMMHALEDSDSEDESPSKVSSSGRPEELQPLSTRRPSGSGMASGSKSESPRRAFSRSYNGHVSPGRSLAKANGTFLTECSFAVAHDRLVEVITDVQPFEPHWEQLGSIDLSNAKLESVARLKEFLPRLDLLCLNHNELAWLSGIPTSVRTLSVAHNCLSGITSYSHLLNLENLDISHNEVDSLRQLECLRHLRELKADGNKITSLDGLQRMDGLVKLSVQGNLIKSIDLGECRWKRLEMLNISHNRLDSIEGLSSLQSLIALNMDMNSLGHLAVQSTMSRLRILRVSGNRLQNLDVGAMPNLRTLYADNNSLTTLARMDRLSKLENLSLRNQSGRGLRIQSREVRDVKRLYLSGNPLKTDFLEEPCYNLIYLELAACRLTGLPEGMAKLLPNLRVLNLNYNFLEDVRALQGFTRLQKLTLIGSRLKSTKPLIRLVEGMPNVEMLDFRMNPCTLGWYLPLLVKDMPGALQPGEVETGEGGRGGNFPSWQELDSKFRRDLPDEMYIGRLAYRGLIMNRCPGMVLLDGVRVTEKERMKAQDLLDGIFGKKKK